jgi:predicted DNA-binding transcriptional regulator YafY
MAKRSKDLETALLMIELLQRIPKGRGREVSTTDLRHQIESIGIKRGARTFQRHLDDLSDHFGIQRDEGSKPYRYSWPENARGWSVPALTLQQSLLLRLAEEHLRNLLPARLMKSMEGFFDQARHNLGHNSNATLERQWPDKVRVVATTQPLLPPKIRPDVFETVTEALYANHELRVDYQNAQGERGKYVVQPLGLAQQGPRLYLVCRFEGHDNERSLALHRIRSAENLGLPFERPKGFDLEQFDEAGEFRFGKGERVRLSFRISKVAGQHLLETPLSTDQQVEETDDAYKITATVVDSEMLGWWLRTFGEAVWDVKRAALPGPTSVRKDFG